MRSALHHRALARIVTIRDAERAAARHALFLAGEREREAVAARERADGRIREAAGIWQEHLAGGGFDPELARGLAGQLIARADAGVAAQAHAGHMAGEREASADAWRQGDARCRQAEQAFDASRRIRARDREERALDALADRITFDWSRP